MIIFKGLIIYVRLLVHRRFYTKRQIKKYQLRKFQKIYKYATENSPYYQELYSGIHIKTLNDIKKLPIINKEIMMENFSRLNTCGIDRDDVIKYAIDKEINKDYYGYYKDKYVVGLSSGTSGNKGIYITPKDITKFLPFVFLARSGLRLKLLPFRIMFLLRIFSQGFDDINSKFINLKYMSTMEEKNDIIENINKMNSNIVMAPPSLLRELLPNAKNITANIKMIVTYAEVLENEDKNRFEKEFKTKVIELFQASEGQIASACNHGHLHINEDLVYIELYDENHELITEDNVVGRKMVITNFVNYAQPLIRYEMNDMIVLDSKCTCGSKFRRIKKIYGRNDDLLYFNTNANELKCVYPDLFVRWIIVTSENIREFQVIQNQNNQVDIYIDLLHEDKFITERLKNKVETELSNFNIVNPDVKIHYKTITLPKNKNKYKRFISNV